MANAGMRKAADNQSRAAQKPSTVTNETGMRSTMEQSRFDHEVSSKDI